MYGTMPPRGSRKNGKNCCDVPMTEGEEYETKFGTECIHTWKNGEYKTRGVVDVHIGKERSYKLCQKRT